MLASSGEITDPCPVPLSLTDTTPSSRMPALSHFWIRRMMRRSPTRCSRKRISHCCLAHSALEPEQEPIIEQRRMIDAVGIADQRVGETAQIDEAVPVSVVARQT